MRLRHDKNGFIFLIVALIIFIILFMVLVSFFMQALIFMSILFALGMLLFVVAKYAPMPYKLYGSIGIVIGIIVLIILFMYGGLIG